MHNYVIVLPKLISPPNYIYYLTNYDWFSKILDIFLTHNFKYTIIKNIFFRKIKWTIWY